MNQFIKTYTDTKASYEVVRKKIKEELVNIPGFVNAKAAMTPELLIRDEGEFDRLNLYLCELETSLEMRYRQSELFSCLDAAEKMLIKKYASFIRLQPTTPALVKELFAEDKLPKIFYNRRHRQQIIAVILRSPGF